MRALVAILALAGCAGDELGLESVLDIPGAQYRPGPFPTASGGPATLVISTRHPSVILERTGEKASATLEPGARTAVFGIVGFDGTWLVPAGPPDASTPALPVATALFGVRDLDPGSFVLRAAAADEHGRFGVAAETMIIATLDPPPTGELVVSLGWATRADLDLHVVAPGGGEAYSDNPNTMPETTGPIDPIEFEKHGILDRDANKDCRVDGGAPSEHVIWTMPPQTGEYIVRVDARAMCGSPGTPWHLEVYRGDTLVGAARGFAVPDDTLEPHGRGAGVLALRFSL